MWQSPSMRPSRTLGTQPLFIVAIMGVALLSVSCESEPNPTAEATSTVSESPSDVPPSSAATSTPARSPMPCDPGTGFPVRQVQCPDPNPETGWLRVSDDGLSLTTFRTLRNDAEGEAFARDNGEEYPFPNDYFDAPTGKSQDLEFTPATVCTGIIQVGYREPLKDHVVTCEELVAVAGQAPLPVAVWLAEGEVIQASELYRP